MEQVTPALKPTLGGESDSKVIFYIGKGCLCMGVCIDIFICFLIEEI